MSLDVERERTIQVLCSHYAHDHLTTQELEQRCERAYAATSADEFAPLVASLPALPAPVDAMQRLQTLEESDATALPERVTAFMSNIRRAGEWTVPRFLKVKAFMGQVKLDLRMAHLPPDATIDVSSIMSEVTIMVSPFVRVETTGSAILGEFDDRSGSMVASVDAGAPRLRITGRATMGAVRIKTRLPNESALEAWRRERRLKKG